MENIEMMCIHPIGKCLQSILTTKLLTTQLPVRLPLRDMELIFWEVRLFLYLHSHVVKALKGANASGTDSNRMAIVSKKFGNGLTVHTNVFGMHLMPLHLLAFNGFKRTCTDVECQFLTIDTMCIKFSQHLRSEMETSRGSSHTAFNL